MLFNLASWHAVLPLGVVWVSGWALVRYEGWRSLLGWIGLLLSSLALAIHVAPGFSNWKIVDSVLIGSSTLPYSLYANLDKALAGLLLLAILIERPSLRIPSRSIIKQTAPHFVASLVVIFGLGILLGVAVEPKFGLLTLVFAYFNLFVTVVAEEAFFRLLIQDSLARSFARVRGIGLIAVMVSGVIFGLAHFHTGDGAAERMTLITVAGCCYAWIYYKSQSYWLAVSLHFAVNIIHFTLFVYPASF